MLWLQSMWPMDLVSFFGGLLFIDAYVWKLPQPGAPTLSWARLQQSCQRFVSEVVAIVARVCRPVRLSVPAKHGAQGCVVL
jgi:hypothetical protein